MQASISEVKPLGLRQVHCCQKRENEALVTQLPRACFKSTS